MAKERLSKIQKFILIESYKYAKENPKDYKILGVFYGFILPKVAEKTGHAEFWKSPVTGKCHKFISNSFRSIFSQSIRNMAQKSLIEVFYCSELKFLAREKPWQYERLRKRHKVSYFFLTPAGEAKVKELIEHDPKLLL